MLTGVTNIQNTNRHLAKAQRGKNHNIFNLVIKIVVAYTLLYSRLD